MAAPAVLTRVIIAALKRWAPGKVGAALKFLGAIELAELARDAYRAIFGGDAPHREAVDGYQSGDAPPEAIAFMRDELRPLSRLDPHDVVRISGVFVDEITEEVALRALDELERRRQADLTVKLLQPPRRCRRKH